MYLPAGPAVAFDPPGPVALGGAADAVAWARTIDGFGFYAEIFALFVVAIGHFGLLRMIHDGSTLLAGLERSLRPGTVHNLGSHGRFIGRDRNVHGARLGQVVTGLAADLHVPALPIGGLGRAQHGARLVDIDHLVGGDGIGVAARDIGRLGQHGATGRGAVAAGLEQQGIASGIASTVALARRHRWGSKTTTFGPRSGAEASSFSTVPDVAIIWP